MNPVERTTGATRTRKLQDTYHILNTILPTANFQRIADVSNLDRLKLPVHAVFRPESESISVSLGKGMSQLTSIVSAGMECYEIWCAEQFRTSGTINDYRHCDLAMSANQREFLRSPMSARDVIESLWTPAETYKGGSRYLIPYDCIHMRNTNNLNFVRGTNGLASGNCRDEALLHGICEVIERDAVAVFHCQDLVTQSNCIVDEKTLPSYVLDLLEAIELANLKVRVFDVTTDIQIPVFLTVLIDENETEIPHLSVVSGAGCSVSAEIAVIRSVTEAAQSRVSLIMATREDYRPEWLLRPTPYLDHPKSVITQFFLTQQGKKQFSETGTARTSIHEHLLEINTRLSALRHLYGKHFGEIIYVCLTPPESPLAAIKVFVTGLEHPVDDVNYTPGIRAHHLSVPH